MFRLLLMLGLSAITTVANAQSTSLGETMKILEWVQVAAKACPNFMFNDIRAVEMIGIAYPADNAVKPNNQALASLIPLPPSFARPPEMDCEGYWSDYGPQGAVFPGLLLLQAN